MAPANLDSHYWTEAEHAENLRLELLAAHGDDSLQGRDKRRTLAAELQALEAHVERHLSEAAHLGVGHRADW